MWKKVEGAERRKKNDYFQILETDLVFRVISHLYTHLFGYLQCPDVKGEQTNKLTNKKRKLVKVEAV